VLSKHAQELAILERDTSKLKRDRALPAHHLHRGRGGLQKLAAETDDPELKENLKIEWGDDPGRAARNRPGRDVRQAGLRHPLPVEAKAFYMEPNKDNPKVVNCTDLLGAGRLREITGGSERIFDRDLMAQRVKTMNISEEAYRWYIDLRRFGSVPHAGFGLGVERVVAWVCGLPHIRETIPYPRMHNRKYP
jgi:asparaginyl-tRNA synthetase